MTATAPSAAPPTRSRPEPDDPSPLEQRVVTALQAMLAQVQLEPVTPSPGGNGVVVMLEHDGVRCILVISPQVPRHTLSPRELQIARLIANGSTNRAIASSLDISLWTVSTHMRRIFAKLSVRSRAEMVAQFYGGADPLPPVSDVAVDADECHCT